MRKTIEDEISRALNKNDDNSGPNSSTQKTNIDNNTMTFEEFYMKRERARQDDFQIPNPKKAKFQKDVKKSEVKEVERWD